MTKDESITDADIYSAAADPVHEDNGRPETVPAAQEQPTPNLGQLPDQGERAQGAPAGQDGEARNEIPQQSPRERGLMSDLQGERKRRQQYESDLAARDRELAELRGRAQAMEQMYRGQTQSDPRQAQPREAPKAPDQWSEPEAWAAFHAQQVFAQHFQPFEQQFQQREQQFQRTIQGLQRSTAVQQYGADAAREAEEAFNTAAARGAIDPYEHARIQRADNPYAAAVEWHRRQQTHERVGSDPEAWFKTEFERRMREDSAFQQQAYGLLNGQAQAAQAAGAQAPAAGRQAPVFVPSVNGAQGASARGAGAISEEDILAAAPTRMGRRG